MKKRYTGNPDQIQDQIIREIEREDKEIARKRKARSFLRTSARFLRIKDKENQK